MEDNKILGKSEEDFEETAKKDVPEFTPQDARKEGETREEYLSRLVGEGKKYKDVEELAKAYYNLNMFAETLKREKREIENEFNKEKERAKTIEEILELVKESGTQDVIKEPVEQQKEDIEKKIAKAIELKEQERMRKEMYNKTLQRLREEFGSEKQAFEYIQKYIGKDKNKQAVINQLGMTDPEGLIALIRPYATQKTDGVATPSGETSYRVNADTNKTAGLPITWSEANKIRKEKPEVYYSGSFQSKLHQAASIAEARGIDFFNT